MTDDTIEALRRKVDAACAEHLAARDAMQQARVALEKARHALWAAHDELQDALAGAAPVCALCGAPALQDEAAAGGFPLCDSCAEPGA